MSPKLSPIMSFFKLLCYTLILVGTNTTQNLAQSSVDNKNITIVLDAGHGGKDNGCTVGNFNEKDIALQLALKIGDAIYEQASNINIIFTRTEDEFIPLSSRSHLANSLEADAFISIHANSYSSDHVNGSEVYVLGPNKNEDNSSLAKRENASLLFESLASQEEYKKLHESPEGHILLSSITNNYLDKSIHLASTIDNQLKKIKGHKSLGVKQASFAVLRNTHMPSILFEVGYMTNKSDLDKMLSNFELNKISHQFAKAIIQFCEEKGQRKDIKDLVPPSPSSERKQIKKMEKKAVVNAPAQKPKMSRQIVEKYSKKKVEEAAVKNTAVAQKEPISKVSQKDKFSLQVATSYSENLELKLDRLSAEKQIFVRQEDGLYVYYIGYYENLKAANDDRLLLSESGYKGAFITKKVFDILPEKSPEKTKKTYNLISY